jgi:ADP-dependent NAD(P)H-hydrate dehydratase / NAD(P)H-hydrate epimerase
VFEPLPTPDEMALWDRLSITDYGVRNEMLMENAAREALAVLQEELGALEGKRAVLFAGPGNNGGDAFALARHLLDQGAEVLVLHTAPLKKYRGVTAYHLGLARRVGVSCRYLPTCDLAALPFLEEAPDIVVDGLLGTGFKGTLRKDYLKWIQVINHLGKHSFVLALDIPSGLDGLTGKPCPTAISATATVTFEAAKLGLRLPGAEIYTGQIHVRRIGIPQAVLDNHPVGCNLLTPKIVSLLPKQAQDMHKGHAGHVLVVGGSLGLTGAPMLAALGALRAGAGLVTIACPASLAAEVKAGVPDIMMLPLPGSAWNEASADALGQALPRFDAVVVGPGIGRAPETSAFLKRLLCQKRAERLSLVLDADALSALGEQPELLQHLSPADILTPHPGEMARLTGGDTASVGKDRLGTARTFTERYGVVLILKGAGTIIASPGSPAFLSPFSAPNLAVGGSGDVLGGVIGALRAGKVDPLHAACLGVYWHGQCGAVLAQHFPRRGNLPREIADALPQAFASRPLD